MSIVPRDNWHSSPTSTVYPATGTRAAGPRGQQHAAGADPTADPPFPASICMVDGACVDLLGGHQAVSSASRVVPDHSFDKKGENQVKCVMQQSWN